MNKEDDNNRIYDLEDRTTEYAKRVIRLCRALPKDSINSRLSGQVVGSAGSVGANYRAACRAKSGRDFLNKLKIVEEELDETMYFIELIVEIKPELNEIWKKSYDESEELLKIMVKSIGTVREKIRK